jgi:nicotinamide-nucleotide amidase
MAAHEAIVHALAENLQASGRRVVTAESCTGGLIASALTSEPGSSNWFVGGFVTYTLEAKTSMLDIAPDTLREHGAVSELVAKLMAEQALEKSPADIAVAVTGLAGPEGDGSATRVGTVWIGFATRSPWGIIAELHQFSGTRTEVRDKAVAAALQGLLDRSASETP